ncbi:MAG: IS110 family transposase [Bdellovibrionales bacterium]|nr:IS110 family transposase [Bdellovibrionales bacterium]
MAHVVHTLGIDLAKRVIQIHGTDNTGQVVLRRRLSRGNAGSFFKKLKPCLIGIEACSGSNHLGRELIALGHDVRLMPASYVKPYVKTNKNDANDAEAICEAVRRPNMRFVPVKSKEQQATLVVHRTRALLMRHRVSLTNAIKAVLAEFGVVVAKHSPGTKDAFRTIEVAADGLPELARQSLQLLVQQWRTTDAHIKECRKKLQSLHKSDPVSIRLATVPGITELAATALVASIGNGHAFKSGRQLAAWLGLVPKQLSSGEQQILGRISKRGDPYLRRLFVLGAMGLMSRRRKTPHAIVHWAHRLADRKRYKLALVALANKLARIAWAVLVKGEAYRSVP